MIALIPRDKGLDSETELMKYYERLLILKSYEIVRHRITWEFGFRPSNLGVGVFGSLRKRVKLRLQVGLGRERSSFAKTAKERLEIPAVAIHGLVNHLRLEEGSKDWPSWAMLGSRVDYSAGVTWSNGFHKPIKIQGILPKPAQQAK